MKTDLRIVTRRVHSAVAPLSDRDRRVIERRARRATTDVQRVDGPRFARRLASCVAAMMSTLPGVTSGRRPPATPAADGRDHRSTLSAA